MGKCDLWLGICAISRIYSYNFFVCFSVALTSVSSTSPTNVDVIIAVIVVVLVLLIIIVVVVLIAFFLYHKYKTPKKGLYSPGHYTATPVANPYDSMELKYKDLMENNDTSKEMEANLSTEVVPEQEPVPVPVAVAPVEGE